MQREILFDKLTDFIDEMKRIGLNKIAIGEVNEKRAIESEPNKLQVAHFTRLDIMSYKDSTIYKCVLKGEDPKLVKDHLASAGFEIKVSNRNIIGPGG
jgi:hypothetical protein